MAVTLNVSLTTEQQALMVQVAASVLAPGSTNAQKLAWATQVAADGLDAEVKRIGIADIDSDAIEAQNYNRTVFLDQVNAAWGV